MSAWDHLLEAVILIMVGVAVATLTTQLLGTLGATGPGCPVDPQWLGYCADIELQ